MLIEGDESITCSYLPTHLEYILFEVLKVVNFASGFLHLLSKPSEDRAAVAAAAANERVDAAAANACRQRQQQRM